MNSMFVKSAPGLTLTGSRRHFNAPPGDWEKGGARLASLPT
jgi:hypothetical protein